MDYYIRNANTGTLVCGSNMEPLKFPDIHTAKEYIKGKNLNKHIYKIVYKYKGAYMEVKI